MYERDPRPELGSRPSWEHAIENTHEPLAVVGRSGELLLANQAFRRFSGGRLEPPALTRAPGHPGMVKHRGRWFEIEAWPLPVGDVLIVLKECPPPVAKERPAEWARRAEFLAVVSHDLRGAMANVRSFAALMLSRGMVTDERARKGVEAIVRNTDRSLALARSVFDSLRHELGAMPVALDPQELDPLLRKAAHEASQSVGRDSVELDLASLPPVPADAERTTDGVRELVRQALLRAGEGGWVRVRATPVPAHVFVAILDNGPPRSPEELRRAFARDEAVEHETRIGDGFALCFAREELEAQGARVRFSTGPDGNVAHLLFPRLEAS